MNADAADIMIATAKGGGWLPISTEEERFASVLDLCAFLADTCAACGVGNRLAFEDGAVGLGNRGERAIWEGELAADPARRAILARAYAFEVFPDSVVVLGERHIRAVDYADWFGVRASNDLLRRTGDGTIQLSEATRFTVGGETRVVLIHDALLPSRRVMRAGGVDHQLERLAIESEATAVGPVADAFIDPPVEVGIYGRSIAATWATPAGSFPVWTSTAGARYLCSVPAALSAILDDAPMLTEPADWARAALRSLGFNATDRGYELTPLLPADVTIPGVGADLISHLDPGEVATHRWTITPRNAP
jgi:hypothetical protein